MSININNAVFMNNNAISYPSISCTPQLHHKHSGLGPDAFLWIVTSLLYINMYNLSESSPCPVLHTFSLFFSSSPSPYGNSRFHHSLFLSSSSVSLENQREEISLLHQRIEKNCVSRKAMSLTTQIILTSIWHIYISLPGTESNPHNDQSGYLALNILISILSNHQHIYQYDIWASTYWSVWYPTKILIKLISDQNIDWVNGWHLISLITDHQHIDRSDFWPTYWSV